VDFGTTRVQVETTLSSLLGAPTGHPNSGCEREYSQIEWNDLVVEFYNGIFIGYRDLQGGWSTLMSAKQSGRGPKPQLTTSSGIGLDSTRGELEAAYPTLRQTGSFTWTSPDGIHFVIDSEGLATYPPPLDTPVREIKIGTCGDF